MLLRARTDVQEARELRDQAKQIRAEHAAGHEIPSLTCEPSAQTASGAEPAKKKGSPPPLAAEGPP
jgi:hypothetical protein